MFQKNEMNALTPGLSIIARIQYINHINTNNLCKPLHTCIETFML